MELTFESLSCAVFDNFLPPQEMHAIFEYFRGLDFKLVHETKQNVPKQMQSGYKRAWRFDEGQALTSHGFATYAVPEPQLPPAVTAIGRKWAEERDTRFFPSATVLDPFISQLKALALQPEWDAEYGGEFLIYDDAVRPVAHAQWQNRRFDPLCVAVPYTDHTRATGGRFMEPLPNRLIVIKRGLMHKVQRVSPLAGSHVRASITGFFLDTHVAQRVMA